MPETSVRQACAEYGLTFKSLETVKKESGEYVVSLVEAYFGIDFRG